ncbi:uncharacterized protein [Porites lutea]|uniref:uncharacterized protein n=1 Tax=Porites lutea TaxID=51062 RepID=UPI003CC5F166
MMLKLTLASILIACFLLTITKARTFHRHHYQDAEPHGRLPSKRFFLKNYNFRRGSCVALGGSGCEANNSKCCRKGDPYTGTPRKCVNKGSFSSPKYECVEA